MASALARAGWPASLLMFAVLPFPHPVARQGPSQDKTEASLVDLRIREPVPTKVRYAVDKGLRYLVRAQNLDGSWGNDSGARGDVSNTCIATLALLSMGNTLTRGKHARQVRKGLDFVLMRARRLGVIGNLDYTTLMQRKLGPNIDLYLCALLFSQVVGLEMPEFERQMIRRTLRLLTNRIEANQKNNGAFEDSYEPMLTTVTAWLALRQAHDAGTTIHGASPAKVVKYLKRECFDPKTGIFREQKWGNRMRFVTQSGGLRVLYGMGQGKSPEARKATDVILSMRFDQDVGGRAGGEEYLGALFATQALQFEEDRNFHRWYRKITKALMRSQNADGSWFGHHCITGRVFCTSCSVITMMTPRKFMPMIER